MTVRDEAIKTAQPVDKKPLLQSYCECEAKSITKSPNQAVSLTKETLDLTGLFDRVDGVGLYLGPLEDCKRADNALTSTYYGVRFKNWGTRNFKATFFNM